MSEKLPISVAEMRSMIGMTVYYQGSRGIIIEVLEDGPSLVLQAHSEATIQSNLHGHPTRRSPQTMRVRVLTDNGRALHKEFLELDLD